MTFDTKSLNSRSSIFFQIEKTDVNLLGTTDNFPPFPEITPPRTISDLIESGSDKDHQRYYSELQYEKIKQKYNDMKDLKSPNNSESIEEEPTYNTKDDKKSENLKNFQNKNRLV